MGYIKTFEGYNRTQINEILKSDVTRINIFLRDLKRKIEDPKIISEISKITDMMRIDPYVDFSEIMDYLYFKYKENPEVCDVILPSVKNYQMSSSVREKYSR